jgi:hypothetical protein
MEPRVAAKVRRVKKFYLPIVPLLKKWIAEDISQSEMAERLNEAGYVNISRRPYQPATISRLIHRLRESG